MSFPIRSLGAAVVCAAVIAGIGAAWARVRFGADDRAAAARLESEVRARIDDRASALEDLARRVATERALIADAGRETASLAALFDRLDALTAAGRGAADPITATVYIPDGAGYRVLAWSDGPAGEIATDRLNGPASIFVAPGTTGVRLVGVRLVYVRPIDDGGRRTAVVATETVLSRAGPDGVARLATTMGPVPILPTYVVGDIRPSDGFVVRSAAGGPLLEVHVPAELVPNARARFFARTRALASVPLAVWLVALTASVIARRRGVRAWVGWSLWSACAIGLAAGAAWIVARAADVFGAPPPVSSAVWALGALAAAAILPVGLLWRAWRRHGRLAGGWRLAAEALAGGGVLAVATLATSSWLGANVTAGTLARWQSSLFPFEFWGVVDIWRVLLFVIALAWTAAALLAASAVRWGLTAGTVRGWLTAALWLAPVVVGLSWRRDPAFALPAFIFAAAIATAALFATALRRRVRRASQASRLMFAFLALLAPLFAVYPLIASVGERTIRTAIEADYGPATAGQADRLREEVARAEQQVDAMAALPEQVRAAVPQEPVDSQLAFSVWRDTSLSRSRVISDIELYGSNRALISRFSLNFPEYVGRASAQTWNGTGCEWRVAGEVTRFGAADRAMLHASRGLCDESGELVGAVVIHVAPSDYRALPFLTAANPYSDVFEIDSAPAPPGLELVVYGWSLRPVFLSGQVAWSLGAAQASRLYREGTPFWTTLSADGRQYHVYLLQNRAGIYALGYPRVTPFEHAARLAEIGAITAVLFVAIQVGALIYAPLGRRGEAPLRVLLHEIRTSFYRKLFLFFVFVATGPVFLFALLFGAYMASKFRADVEAQAAGVVTVARRVFEEVASANERPALPAVPPTDDVMVWIRQVIGQDVNLFEGADLRATSQRDLFNSGLLPTRTPAIVYRRVVLDRLPWFVAEDRETLVAASRVPADAADRILSVPLVSRQREIEEEMDDLGRGVLVGSIFVVLFSAALGASLAGRVSDPVARLTRATRQIAAGRLDVRMAADTADELGRLVEDFNVMTATLVAQRAELARTNQLQAWNEMARQVAHEIKNPLTPVQLAAEHLQRVHEDRGRPLGATFDQCITTILGQVRLLRQIASEFANFAGEPVVRPERLRLPDLIESVVGPYRLGLTGSVRLEASVPPALPAIVADRTLVTRALANLVENAIQAMPMGGVLTVTAAVEGGRVVLRIADTGVGMDADARDRAFEPYFSTKVGGSGLGLANARRNIEREGGTIALESEPGRGTVVTVTWPAAPRDASADGPPPSR